MKLRDIVRIAPNKVMTIHWGDFITEIDRLNDPTDDSSKRIILAQELLQRIKDEDLPASYMFALPDEVFQVAEQLLEPRDDADAQTEVANFAIDDDAWATFAHSSFRLKSVCDPSIAEVFI